MTLVTHDIHDQSFFYKSLFMAHPARLAAADSRDFPPRGLNGEEKFDSYIEDYEW